MQMILWFFVLYTMAYLHTSPILLFMFFWHLEELICQFTPFEPDLQCISVGIVSFKFICALPNQPNKNPGCSSRLRDAVCFFFLICSPLWELKTQCSRSQYVLSWHDVGWNEISSPVCGVKSLFWLRLTNSRVCFILPNDSRTNPCLYTSVSFPSFSISSLISWTRLVNVVLQLNVH